MFLALVARIAEHQGKAKMTTHLVVIDPQKDFCLKTGALSVPGADADMDRLATMVRRISKKLDDISVTLDSHHLCDVAHPIFWKGKDGKHPAPFTIISAQDVRDGVWRPSMIGLTKRMIDYTSSLEKSKRYPLCIWPPHCLIGSVGAAVYDALFGALNYWAETEFATINWVTKGSNPFVEHYSAVQAEVADPADPSTQLNVGLINTLEQADIIAFAGEAGSHCLKATTEDIFNNFSSPDIIKKCVLLTDATSPVISPFVDFPKIQKDFIAEMKARGMQTALTTDFLA